MCRRILTRRYASSPRKDKSEYERSEERLQGIAEGKSSARPLPTHQPRHFPGEMSVREPTVA